MEGKFNYMLGEGKEVILGDKTFVCKPLSARYLSVFANSKEEDKEELVFNIVAATLQQTDKTITVDDVKDMPLGKFQLLSQVIIELNELDGE